MYGQLPALRCDYAEAVPALLEAIDRLREQPGIELTVATEMLGATYAYMGDFDRALELIESAHARSERVQDQAALAVEGKLRQVAQRLRHVRARGIRPHGALGDLAGERHHPTPQRREHDWRQRANL